MARQEVSPLRRGWTTGACAAAAVRRAPEVALATLSGAVAVVVVGRAGGFLAPVGA
jgi:cobalamin biosynthesis protein CbiD